MSGKITIANTLKRLSNLPPPENMSDNDRKFYSEIGAALMRNELELLIANKQWVFSSLLSTHFFYVAHKNCWQGHVFLTTLLLTFFPHCQKRKLENINF